MINFLIMIGGLLTAFFTGGLFYKGWYEKQPSIDVQGEPRTEKECKISLTIYNPTKKTQKVERLLVIEPAYSSLCRIYNVRGIEIPERHHYDTSISNVISIKPESTEQVELFVSKGVESASTILILMQSTWSKIPFIHYSNHKVEVEC